MIRLMLYYGKNLTWEFWMNRTTHVAIMRRHGERDWSVRIGHTISSCRRATPASAWRAAGDDKLRPPTFSRRFRWVANPKSRTDHDKMKLVRFGRLRTLVESPPPDPEDA